MLMKWVDVDKMGRGRGMDVHRIGGKAGHTNTVIKSYSGQKFPNRRNDPLQISTNEKVKDFV